MNITYKGKIIEYKHQHVNQISDQELEQLRTGTRLLAGVVHITQTITTAMANKLDIGW